MEKCQDEIFSLETTSLPQWIMIVARKFETWIFTRSMFFSIHDNLCLPVLHVVDHFRTRFWSNPGQFAKNLRQKKKSLSWQKNHYFDWRNPIGLTASPTHFLPRLLHFVCFLISYQSQRVCMWGWGGGESSFITWISESMEKKNGQCQQLWMDERMMDGQTESLTDMTKRCSGHQAHLNSQHIHRLGSQDIVFLGKGLFFLVECTRWEPKWSSSGDDDEEMVAVIGGGDGDGGNSGGNEGGNVCRDGG